MDFSWLAQGVPQVQLPDPMQSMVKGLTLADLARRNRMNAEDDQQRRLDRQAQVLAAQALGRVQAGGDYKTEIQTLASQGDAGALAAQRLLAIRKADEGAQAETDQKRSVTKKNEVEARLKIATAYGNRAFALAQDPSLTPQKVADFQAGLRMDGIDKYFPEVDQHNPREWLKGIAAQVYDVKDQVTQAETGRHNRATEQQGRDTLSEQSRHNLRQEGFEGARVGIERQRMESGKWQYDASRGLMVNPTTAQTKPAMGQDGQPIGTVKDPAIQERARQSSEMADRVLQMVAEVKPHVAAAAGIRGAVASKIPGTPAYDYRAQLESIKANLGFEQLQQMRASSPTGGALGQVSDMENRLLASTVASLDPNQSPKSLAAQLAKVERHMNNVKMLMQGRMPPGYDDAGRPVAAEANGLGKPFRAD